jgi:SAM-dependent methyltransferase
LHLFLYENAMRKVESMRRDWDARASKDAFYYIASWRKDWDAPSFFASGDEDYQRLVAPVLDRFGFAPAGKSMLELGCGAGRMTRAFAAHFHHVVAVDVSAQMLDQARHLLSDTKNIAWQLANGANLSDIPSESLDFAFSYLVLQHLPDEELVRGYVHELLRVLRPSGICLFQFNGRKRPTMNWKGTLAWGVVDALWSIRLPKVSRLAARSLGFDPEMAGGSWHGASVTTERVLEAAGASGGTILDVSGDGTPMVWCCATKTGA